MILALRQRHRGMIVVIGLFLPIAFGIGIVARKTMPPVAALPETLSQWSQHFTAISDPQAGWFTNAPIRVQFWREVESGRMAAGFSADPDYVKPDLIVYWAKGAALDKPGLPANATLLGAFVAGPLVLPVEATTATGQLVLFSLANQEVVAVSRSARLSDAAN